MKAGPVLDTVLLENRRRLSLRAAVIALSIAVVGFPLGMRLGKSEGGDTVGGALFLAAIAGAIAAPWIVRGWQNFMRRRMIAAAVAGQPDVRHIDGETQRTASQQALSSDAFSLASFRDSGLVEPFETAVVNHILIGSARSVPFAITEIHLLDAKGYRMFLGVLASFRLSRPRPGLTVVTRDHGILGNLLAHAGSGIERLPLEDPTFEGVFQVYGTDQVAGRVILTTTMLERLKALDRLADAHGFACAFKGEHILIALRGMSWRCPPWRIVRPVDTWLQLYVAWLAGLMDLPVEIVRTLNLDAPSGMPAAAFVPAAQPSIPVDTGSEEVFSSGLWRLVGEGGMAVIYIASGSLFGGVALFGAWYGLKVGYPSNLFGYFWGLIAGGVVYGAFAIATGLREVARLAWRWNAPLRSLKRPSRLT